MFREMLSNFIKKVNHASEVWDKGMYLSYLHDTQQVKVNFKKTTLIDLERGEY